MGVFHSGSSNHTCPTEPSGPQYGNKYVVGSMNFHQLTIILSGAFAAAACIISALAILQHAFHFSNHEEQKKIIRIMALIPCYAILSFLGASFPNAAVYVQPWTDAYESMALANFFLLMVHWVAPVPETREAVFAKLEGKDSKGNATGGGSTAWFHRTWIFAFQYIPVSWIVAIGTDASQAAGTYCLPSSKPYFFHLWATILRSISVAAAFINVLRFYSRFKSEFKQHRAFSKLLGIKGIVFLSFIQQIIFTILHSANALNPTSTLSYDDLTFGIPNLLLCAEMILFALLQFYAYNVGPYKASSKQGGPLTALVSAASPVEIFQSLIIAVGFCFGRTPAQQRKYDDVGIEPLRTDPRPTQQAYGVTNLQPSYPYQPQRAHSPNRNDVTRNHSQSPNGYDETYVRGRNDLEGQYTPLAGPPGVRY